MNLTSRIIPEHERCHEQDIEETGNTGQDIIEANFALVSAVRHPEDGCADGKCVKKADRY
jgi:hypothetical protein